MAEQSEVATMPVQVHRRPNEEARAPVPVVMRAYEVYCHVYGPQEAMVTGECRGGFGVCEIVAFLYARSFPKEEWSDRVDEAFRGLRLGAS